VENMTDYQYAWILYLIGATGCVLAAWLLFRRFGRAITHFFVITAMVVLFTPYAIDAETMTMAPAVYTLLFGFMDGGFIVIKPVLKLMLGLWGCALILSLIYQLLTRHKGRADYDAPDTHHPQSRRQGRKQAYSEDDEQDFDYPPQTRRTNSSRGLSREERIARDELLREEPIRAIR
jgi:hypothetical protein